MTGTVALTGATGFVGAHTVDALLRAGYHVRALTRRAQPARQGVEWVPGALDNPESLDMLCRGADLVLHIAGVVNAPDKAGFHAGNVAGTANMIAAARANGVARFIHVSSLSAREPRLSVYGDSKWQGEELVSQSGMDWTIVRPPGVYGPGDTEMLDLFRMAKRGVMLLPPAGRISLIHVGDLSLFLARLVQTGGGTGQIFDVDDGRDGGWSHLEYAHMIGRSMGRRIFAVHVPRILLFAAANGDRLVRGNAAKLTPDRAGYLSHDNWVVDAGARPPAAIWTPQIPTEEGVAETARWYAEKGWL